MATLCLYIDRWHLFGAVCTEQRCIPLEDKYWLYFHENMETERVEYGKCFETYYLNREEHYIGDIFSLIIDPRESFLQYGHNTEIDKIFADSGLFDDLVQEAGKGERIDTYISFADEVPKAAQLLMIKAMENHQFTIKEKVAKIEHLLLEHEYRKKKIGEDGYYLVLNATTNDLRYSVYRKEENLFAEVRSEKLAGLGRDARGRALVEAVVEKMNANLQLLVNDEEKEYERNRFRLLYLDSWLERLANTDENHPATFSNISFSKAPNNWQNIMVMIRDIDNRTRSIVSEIVQEIAKFARDLTRSGLHSILFLGDVFSNKSYDQEIVSRFAVSEDSLYYYPNSTIPSIVATYNYIDCSQFTTANREFETQSETERQSILNAIAEEEGQHQANEAIEEAKRIEDEKRNREKGYRDAMDHVYEFEHKGDYTEMKEWCEVALRVNPDDEEARKKLNEAVQLLSEEKLRHEQYNEALRRAKQSVEEGRYQDAVSQCEVALAAIPESAEAKRILTLAKETIDTTTQIERLIDRTDLFLGQKLYAEALNEVSKILTIDSTNKQAKQKKQEIEQLIAETNARIDELKLQLKQAKQERNYNDAKTVLNKLIIEDKQNQLQWSQELLEIKQEEIAATEKAEKVALIRKKIEESIVKENFDDALDYCNQYLMLSEDEEISKLKIKIDTKLNFEKNKSLFLQEYESENWGNAVRVIMRHPQLKRDSIILAYYNEAKKNIPKKDGVKAVRPPVRKSSKITMQDRAMEELEETKPIEKGSEKKRNSYPKPKQPANKKEEVLKQDESEKETILTKPDNNKQRKYPKVKRQTKK